MTKPAIFVRAIVTEEDHDWAIKRITSLMEPSPELGTDEDYELDALITLVDWYEQKHFPMGGSPNAISMILFMLDQKGLSRKDLEPMIGTRARVSEVLSGKRTLTLNMIRKLHTGLDIPLEFLVTPESIGIRKPGIHAVAKRKPRAIKVPVSVTVRRQKAS